MKIKKFLELRNKFGKLIISYLIFLTLLVACYFEINRYINLLENTKLAYNSGILTARKALTDLKTELSEVEAAKKILQKPEDLTNTSNDLDIEEAKEITAYLQEQYNILNVDLNMSTPKNLDNLDNISNYNIVSSDVDIKFSAMSDENVFQFVDAIINNFSGFKLVKSFKVIKKKKINNDVLEQIKNGNSTPLITAELVFEWQDLKGI